MHESLLLGDAGWILDFCGCSSYISMRRLIGLVFCCLLLSSAFGQQLDQVKIDGLYIGSLDKVLDQITSETGIKFSFDREKFSKYKFETRAFELPVSEFLNQLGKQYKLKYYQDESGAINLIDQYVLVNDKVVSAKPVVTRKKYKGNSSRSNLALNGTIKDKVTGESLPFVNLQVQGTAIGTSANVDGYFSLLKVPSDTVSIVVSYLGYDPTIIQLTPETKTDNIIIEMEQSAVRLDEVIVSSQREHTTAAFQSNEKVSMIKMTPSKIMTLPNIGERDIFRSFQLMPGVSAANENSAGLYVRGGTPDQALVLYDGFTVYNVDHLFGFYSAFNYNAIKEVQLYKGGFESKFGGRLSSVAEITAKEGNQRQFNVGGDLSLLSMNLFAEFPAGDKVTVFVAARKSWKGPIYDKIFKTFSGSNNSFTSSGASGQARGRFANFGTTVSSYFYDLNSKATYRPTDKDIISWSIYNGTDNLDNSRKLNASSFFANANLSFNANINDVTNWGNTGSSLKWSRRWNTKYYSNTLVSYSNYFSRRDRSNETSFTRSTGDVQNVKTGTIEDNDLYDFSFKTDHEFKLNDKNSLEFGGQITQYDIQYTFSQNDTSTIIDRHTTGATYVAYFQDRLRLLQNRLLVVPGIRYNYYDITKSSYTEPRFSINYLLNKHITLKGATGRYYQFAKRVIREDILQGSRDFWTLADGNNLPVSYANHFIAGASYETDLLLFDVEAYYKQLYGLSEYSLRFTPSFGKINYSESFYQGTGETRGIDFLIQKKSGSYTGWIGYTLSQTTNTFAVYQEKPYLASQNVTNEFKSINMYKYRNWDFSLTWFYASGKPYTAPQGGYTVTLLDGNTNSFTNVSSKNSLHLPDYQRMDLAITYHWTSGRGAMNSLGLSFFNLYNHQNIWYKDYQIVAGQLIETNVYYLGFTPNLTLSWKLK